MVYMQNIFRIFARLKYQLNFVEKIKIVFIFASNEQCR